MGDFLKLQLQKHASIQKDDNPEGKFWQRFKMPEVKQLNGPVTHVDFCEQSPVRVVSTSSLQLDVFSASDFSSYRVYTSFKDVAIGGSFRRDGSLLAAGGREGRLRIFTVAQRGVLRSIVAHAGAMHVAQFSHGGQHVLTGGDDRRIKLWDIATGLPVADREAHGDYVRCATPSGPSSWGWGTGGLDHRVKLWDLRAASKSSASASSSSTDGFGGIGSLSSSSSSSSSSTSSAGPQLDMDHGHPVTSLRFMRGGSLLASAGGPVVKVWDLVAGGRLLCEMQAHQKGVTSLALDGTGSRLLSGSLDGTIASYSLSDFTVTHRMRHIAPVLSLAVAPDNNSIAIGGEDGSLAMRRRVTKAAERAEERSRQAVIKGGTQRFFLRGKGAEPRAEDLVVQGGRKPQLQAYEVLLKRFEYGAALDASLQQGNPIVASALLAELAKRGGLRAALSGRDDAELVPVLAFITRYVAHPRYAQSMQAAAHVVLDLYAPSMGRAPAVDRLFAALYAKLEREIKLEQELLRLQGAVEALLGAHAAGAVAARGGAATLAVKRAALEEEEEDYNEDDISPGAAGRELSRRPMALRGDSISTGAGASAGAGRGLPSLPSDPQSGSASSGSLDGGTDRSSRAADALGTPASGKASTAATIGAGAGDATKGAGDELEVVGGKTVDGAVEQKVLSAGGSSGTPNGKSRGQKRKRKTRVSAT